MGGGGRDTAGNCNGGVACGMAAGSGCAEWATAPWMRASDRRLVESRDGVAAGGRLGGALPRVPRWVARAAGH